MNSAYRGESSRLGWTTEADFLDGQRTDETALANILKQAHILTLRTAENQEGAGEILACVELSKLSPNEVLLGMLSVNPRFQNLGLGAKLIRFAENFASNQLGAHSILMKVISIRSELIAYYERKSYRRIQKSEPFPYGDERFGVPKREDLEFVHLQKIL